MTKQQHRQQLREKLLAGASSPPSVRMDKEYRDWLRRRFDNPGLNEPPPPEPSKDESSQPAQITPRKLWLIRAMAITMIIAMINITLRTIDQGFITVDSTKLKFSVSGDNLWAGYLFLATWITAPIYLLFINYGQSPTFKRIGNILAAITLCTGALVVFLSD